MAIELKIKAKHLSSESSIIRGEESRIRKSLKRLTAINADKEAWKAKVQKSIDRLNSRLETESSDKVRSHIVSRTENLQSELDYIESLPDVSEHQDKISDRISSLSKQLSSINHHRKDKVGLRGEARATHLAYAFSKGRSYSEVEASCKTEPNWKRVEEMASKYAPNFSQEFSNWRNT